MCSTRHAPLPPAPADSGAPLSQQQAAVVSCQLGLLLDRVVGNGSHVAEQELFTIYRAWRQAYRPQVRTKSCCR